ncbi:MAG TPA: hypothetical protein VN737_02355 [Bryobacteraceae bacterium]|nr:hypothetical protein [Bryobacteraceae bacterium]
MNSSLQIAFAASALAWMAGSLFGKAGKEVAPKEVLAVSLYNEAKVNPGTLRWAIVEADRLFQAAGIQLNWQFPAEAQLTGRIDGAVHAQTNDGRYIVMRLIRQAPATASPDAAGLARPFAQTGVNVSVFFDRLELLAHSVNAAIYIILGHVMAHEIGHVLLHSTEHSANGLMQAQLGPASWRQASAGLLAFRHQEAQRMYQGLRSHRSTASNRLHRPLDK